MAGSSRTASDLAVQKLLQRLHDSPSNSESVQEVELDTIYAYLQRSSVTKLSSLHWFCRHADPITTQAAIFLLRLFAYSSPKVETWKGWLNGCLGGCSECVMGLEKAKISSRDSYVVELNRMHVLNFSFRYFGAFPEHVMSAFWDSFNNWELEHTLAQISDTSAWTDIPTPTLYRMICNFQIFQDSRIQTFLEQHPPSRSPSDWPAEPIPPAMLVLMMHENATLRDWSVKQASRCTNIPISQDDAAPLLYDQALEIIMLPFISTAQARSDSISIRLITETVTLWSSFHSVLRLLHPKQLTFFSSKGVDVRHVVTGHLHDHGPGQRLSLFAALF